MTAIYGVPSAGDRAEYFAKKEQMWSIFSRLTFEDRLSVLWSESWPMVIFAVAYFLYEFLTPRSVRWVMHLFDISAMAQTAAFGGMTQSDWRLAIAVMINLMLLLILAACVIWLLTAPKGWTNTHAWVAKTATFLLGFLTKAAQGFM